MANERSRFLGIFSNAIEGRNDFRQLVEFDRDTGTNSFYYKTRSKPTQKRTDCRKTGNVQDHLETRRFKQGGCSKSPAYVLINREENRVDIEIKIGVARNSLAIK